jgi:hypothetical protein
VFPATRPLDILVQLFREEVIELRAKVRRMERDGVREGALLFHHDDPGDDEAQL